MRGMKYSLGKSWPRNPVPSDPSVVRERTRSHGRPIPPGGMGL